MNNLSTKKTNVTSTVSINCQSKKVRNYYILHTVLLAIILQLLIIIICYYCAKTKINIKWKRMNLKKLLLKIMRVIISMI